MNQNSGCSHSQRMPDKKTQPAPTTNAAPVANATASAPYASGTKATCPGVHPSLRFANRIAASWSIPAILPRPTAGGKFARSHVGGMTSPFTVAFCTVKQKTVAKCHVTRSSTHG